MPSMSDPESVKSSILDAIRAHLDELQKEGTARAASTDPIDLYTKNTPRSMAREDTTPEGGATERMTDLYTKNTPSAKN